MAWHCPKDKLLLKLIKYLISLLSAHTLFSADSIHWLSGLSFSVLNIRTLVKILVFSRLVSYSKAFEGQ